MRYLTVAALPLVCALAACAYTKSSSPGSAPTQSAGQQGPASPTGAGGAPPSTTASPASTPAPASTSANPSPSKPPASTGSGSSAPRQAAPAKDAKPQSPTAVAPKPKSPSPTRSEPSKSATASAPGSQPPNGTATPAAPAAATAPAAAKPNPPTAPSLDLASLEQRLKDTKAIGLFTKLSLKNQVDDLLSQFRAFYDRKSSLSLGELRQRYDLLLLKVLSLLQDGDPPLASAISGSREAIWGILSDPQKFAKL